MELLALLEAREMGLKMSYKQQRLSCKSNLAVPTDVLGTTGALVIN